MRSSAHRSRLRRSLPPAMAPAFQPLVDLIVQVQVNPSRSSTGALSRSMMASRLRRSSAPGSTMSRRRCAAWGVEDRGRRAQRAGSCSVSHWKPLVDRSSEPEFDRCQWACCANRTKVADDLAVPRAFVHPNGPTPLPADSGRASHQTGPAPSVHSAAYISSALAQNAPTLTFHPATRSSAEQPRAARACSPPTAAA